MIRDAEQFSEQDKKKREEVELRNNADSLIYTAEKTKKDLSDKLTQEQNGKIDAGITALKDALASNDFTQVKTKPEELQKTLQDVGTAVYQQAAAEQAKQQQAQSAQQNQEPQGPQDAGPGSERVVDSDGAATEDHQKRELVDQRNQADNLAYQVEKLLAEHRAKLTDSDATAIEQAVAEARKAAEGDDAEKIKAAIEALTKQSHKLAEQLYKQTGGPAAGAPGATAGPEAAQRAGDVVDAEYTVKGN